MDDYCCNKYNCLHRLALQPQLHDVNTTCHLLSISRSTFYALAKKGRISVSKVGNKTLVSSFAIRDFVQAVDGNGITDDPP
jgi:excisionase family DNA binding protein